MDIFNNFINYFCLLCKYLRLEDNIYDKLIKDQMLAGNYSEAKSVVTQTLNKKYADDETYYLSGLITATESSQSEAIAEWERGLKAIPIQAYSIMN